MGIGQRHDERAQLPDRSGVATLARPRSLNVVSLLNTYYTPEKRAGKRPEPDAQSARRGVRETKQQTFATPTLSCNLPVIPAKAGTHSSHRYGSDRRLLVEVQQETQGAATPLFPTLSLEVPCVCVRTGRVVNSSAARFPRMPTTGLAQRHAPPQVSHQFAKLLAQRHRLIKVGQDISQ